MSMTNKNTVSMKNKKMTAILLCVFLMLSLFVFSSCDSVDKDDATLDLNDVTFEYYEETNVTMVSCKAEIQNATIYNLDSFAVDLGVYCNGERIETEPYQYTHRIKHGETESVSISFTVEGKADYVGLVTWTPHYEPLWKTYINVIVVAAVVIIVGVAYWVKEGLF